MNAAFKKWKNIIIIAAVLLAVIYMSQFSSGGGPNEFMSTLLCTTVIYAIVATGLDLMFGYSGQISFGHVAFYAYGAYFATFFTKTLGLPHIVGILGGTAVATLIGFLFAIPATRLQKHFLSFMTIAFATMTVTLSRLQNPITNGAIGINQIPSIVIFGVTFNTFAMFIWISLAALALILIIKRNIIHSRAGRAFLAIKASPHAAAGMGIDVQKYKIMAITISAGMAGFAGTLFAFSNRTISPEAFIELYGTLFMACVLFGGLGTFAGPVLGAFLLRIIQNYLQVFHNYQQLIYAVLIILVLYVMPNGVVGLFRSLVLKIKHIRTQTAEEEDAHAAT